MSNNNFMGVFERKKKNIVEGIITLIEGQNGELKGMLSRPKQEPLILRVSYKGNDKDKQFIEGTAKNAFEDFTLKGYMSSSEQLIITLQEGETQDTLIFKRQRGRTSARMSKVPGKDCKGNCK